MTISDRFEDRLMTQLRLVVADNSSPAIPLSVTTPRRVRLSWSLASAGTAVAAAAAAIVITAGSSTSPAYAVARQPNGMVTVQIHDLSDASGLQSALRADGVPAVVDYRQASAGCALPPNGTAQTATASGGQAGQSGSYAEVQAGPGGIVGQLHGQVEVSQDGSVRFSIDTSKLPSGDQVWITTATGKVSSIAVVFGTQRSPAAPCMPLP